MAQTTGVGEGQSGPLEEARRIVEMARDRGVTLRLIGGLGIRFHCHGPHSSHLRDYHDIDLFGLRKESIGIYSVFQALGYFPNVKYNFLYGDTRLQFVDNASRRNVDVFLDRFKMEHNLDLSHRLSLDEMTVPITDLLLTKLQIEDLTEKDLKDIVAILEDHEIGHADEPEALNLDYIAELCARDWGLYKTLTDNVDWLADFIREKRLSLSGSEPLLEKLANINNSIKASKKSFRWTVRSLIGVRIRWYQQVETGEGEFRG